MRPLVAVARAAGFAVITFYVMEELAERVASKVYQKSMPLMEVDFSKEGTMTGLNAEDVDLSHLDLLTCDYPPKNIHTEAIYVTPENIGKLSLEFEEELFYDGSGRPYFMFTASRGNTPEVEEQSELYVRLTDWIVPLRGELHVFRDQVFRSTFTADLDKTFEQGRLTNPVAFRDDEAHVRLHGINAPLVNVEGHHRAEQPDFPGMG